MRIIPKTSKVKLTFYRNFTIADIVVGLFFLLILAITLSTNLPFRFLLAIGEFCVAVPFFVSINGERLYQCVGFLFKYAASRKKYRKGSKNLDSNMDAIVPYRKIENGFIVNGDGTYVGVLVISPIDFRMMSQDDQDGLIDGVFSRALNLISPLDEWSLVKLEKPLNLDENLEDELIRLQTLLDSKMNGEMTETEYQSRVDLVQSRIELIDSMNSEAEIYYSHYYLCLISHSKNDAESTLGRAISILVSGGLAAKRLDDEELYSFVSAGFGLREERKLCVDDVKFSLMKARQNGKSVSHIVLNDYPLKVNNGWGEGLFDMENTKVVMRIKPVDKAKAVKRIDNAILEIQTGTGSFRASDVLDKEVHLDSLQDLLEGVQNENETLFDTTVILSVYDEFGESKNKKAVKAKLRDMGFGYTEMLGRQNDAYVTSMLSSIDKVKISRGIQTSSIAACFPFVSNAIMDNGGLLIGENRLPVFLDFFKRDSEFVNSNMVIMGKPGSGKSYAAKTIIFALASDDCRVFVLDPENEYGRLAENLGGACVDVSSSKHGMINPFEVILGIDEDGNSFYSHLQFLEEFYRLILKGINADSLELLNKITQELYKRKGIGAESDFKKFTANDYPTFDELGELVKEKIDEEKDEYNRSCLKVIENYISKFVAGGRNSNLWNGHTSFSPKEQFLSFDFQRLLANKNDTTANAQMLLILKWVENEVMKNRDRNMRSGKKRRIVAVIDEAHLFIDDKYPIALDFMFQLAKRIRKYDGMLIIITQNVKDFATSPETIRKSSAIINVSQYSMIFSLSPNDMTELCALYQNAGSINESEKDAIIHNPRGRAFLVSSPSKRGCFDVVATDMEERYFL